MTLLLSSLLFMRFCRCCCCWWCFPSSDRTRGGTVREAAIRRLRDDQRGVSTKVSQSSLPIYRRPFRLAPRPIEVAVVQCAPFFVSWCGRCASTVRSTSDRVVAPLSTFCPTIVVYAPALTLTRHRPSSFFALVGVACPCVCSSLCAVLCCAACWLQTPRGAAMHSYRGDIVNGLAFTEASRRNDPYRMVSAYHQSAQVNAIAAVSPRSCLPLPCLLAPVLTALLAPLLARLIFLCFRICWCLVVCILGVDLLMIYPRNFDGSEGVEVAWRACFLERSAHGRLSLVSPFLSCAQSVGESVDSSHRLRWRFLLCHLFILPWSSLLCCSLPSLSVLRPLTSCGRSRPAGSPTSTSCTLGTWTSCATPPRGPSTARWPPRSRTPCAS